MQRESTQATEEAEESRLHCLSPLREGGILRLSTQQFALGLGSVRLSTQQFAFGLRLPQGVCKYAALAMATSPVLQHSRVQQVRLLRGAGRLAGRHRRDDFLLLPIPQHGHGTVDESGVC
jgi:hypothetical protein